jgi:hypothetical protein
VLSLSAAAALLLQVEEFFRWPLAKVMEVVAGSTQYKPNCNLVVIDFLVRHGAITPDMPGYLDVVRGLRAGDGAGR